MNRSSVSIYRHCSFPKPGWRFASGSKAWIQRQRNDHFVQQAKDQDLRARSAFKLQEIQAKHKFIHASSLVLDLGAAPGGWSTIASKIIQPTKGGLIIAVDLLPIEPVAHTSIIQGDFTSAAVKEQIKHCILSSTSSKDTPTTILKTSYTDSSVPKPPVQFDVVLSDMLHNTTGVHDTDHYKSISLVRHVISYAVQPSADFPQGLLKFKGTILTKFLRGEDEKELVQDMKELFQTVQIVKPKSSRSESREAFLLLQNRKS